MLRELLTADGVLIISTVNANSLLLKAYLTDWGGFTPNHLVFFSPTTMPELLRQAGFGAVVFRPMYAVPTRPQPDHGAPGAAAAAQRRPRQPGAHAARGGLRRPRRAGALGSRAGRAAAALT